MEKNLETKLASLNNLQMVQSSIESLHTDRMVFDSLSKGSEALKELKQSFHLDADRVDDMMAELGELMSENEEVSTILAEPIVADTIRMFHIYVHYLLFDNYSYGMVCPPPSRFALFLPCIHPLHFLLFLTLHTQQPLLSHQ